MALTSDKSSTDLYYMGRKFNRIQRKPLIISSAIENSCFIFTFWKCERVVLTEWSDSFLLLAWLFCCLWFQTVISISSGSGVSHSSPHLAHWTHFTGCTVNHFHLSHLCSHFAPHFTYFWPSQGNSCRWQSVPMDCNWEIPGLKIYFHICRLKKGDNNFPLREKSKDCPYSI